MLLCYVLCACVVSQCFRVSLFVSVLFVFCIFQFVCVSSVEVCLFVLLCVGVVVTHRIHFFQLLQCTAGRAMYIGRTWNN